MSKKENVGEMREVEARVNIDEMERGILNFWETEDIFHASLEQNKDGKLFTFYDGPPYATGKPHYGHILQSAIKDTVLRYKTMQGYYVPRRVGWDCHGLPIENLVEKEFGIKSKKEIEDDIEGFNKKCRDTVLRYINDFTSTLQRMGRWADYDQAYSTLDRDYMETEWWVFKQLWDQELVYKGFRSTPYCIRCQTPLSNFEVSMEYKDKVDTAVYVALPVSETDSLLVWTTTPWTLPANVAVAIGSDIQYVSVAHEGKNFVVATSRVEALFGTDAEVVKQWKNEELLALTYTPLYESTLSDEEKAKSFRVVVGAHVTDGDGTGLVHMAPAFGEEDFEVGKKEELPVLRTVGLDGNYFADVPMWAGKNVFEANAEIVADLKGRGLLWKEEQYTHSYPHCWRCDTPLIYYALDSWFVRVTELKDQMLKNGEDIHWVPDHVKAGRFGKGIESAPDWAVSRNRFWSVPIPVWECAACKHSVCVGSVADLKQLSGVDDSKVEDLHRPYVDDITWKCEECGDGEMKRVTEVLDVWFDSGSMPYSQWHYPFDNKEFVEKGFPADFIVESIEMTRAWFYVLHVLATALTRKDIGLGTDKPAYTNVIASGLIFAEDGKKLSKKLKNYPEPEPTVAKYGADTLRFYLLSSTSLGEPYYFSEKDLQQLQRNVFMTLWNVYSFFTRYAKVNNFTGENKGESQNLLDQWVLARVAQLEQQVMEAAEGYHMDTAARLFIPFIDDLSNWYVRRSRQRFQRPTSETEAQEAFSTLHTVLVRVVTVLAPFMPFVSEEMYRNLTGGKSVHLTQLSSPSSFNEKILSDMKVARDVVSAGLALRAKSALKVRQPLSQVAVQMEESLNDELLTIIKEEVNVKEVKVVSELPTGEGWVVSSDEMSVKVGLNTELTDELKAEGVARDIIRQGQVLRREAGYALRDRIVLIISTQDPDIWAVIRPGDAMIREALQVDTIEYQGEEDAGAEVKINGIKIHIGVKKV